MIRIIRKMIPGFAVNLYHMGMPVLGALIYKFPAKKIRVIGITGTNGKTTTVHLTADILREAGIKTAVLSSVKFEIGGKKEENLLKMTMPGRFAIQRFLRKAVDAKCRYAVIEITSEGIKQHRHLFIDFHTAAITNLSPEHIESHGGFENYKRAKGMLFKAASKNHVINIDDEHKDYFLQFEAEKKWGYGIDFKGSFKGEAVLAEDPESDSRGIRFKVRENDFEMGLLGRFNIYNALAAICIGMSCGIDLKTIKKTLEKSKGTEGRMEEVVSSPFKVFVDYAFTPNALDKVYRTLRDNFNPRKMICVLGACGGGRDKWKRPVLGGIARSYCDEVIVTNEDPYDEDPMDIINAVAEGAKGKALKVLDRRKAIGKALDLAREGDIVVITGKGVEPWLCVSGGRKIPWDDRKIARDEFKKRG